jgi:8-oxo-dGTP diphosphatase
MAGGWEFPGGKLAEGEAPYAGLVRELREEIGVEVLAGEPLIAYAYDYPDKRVWLDLWRVLRYAQTPRSLDGQALRWIALDDLPGAPLLEADRPMVDALLGLNATKRVAADE